MRRKRKRKFSLLSAIFLELASLAGIIAVAQPTMVLSWIGVELNPRPAVSESVPAESPQKFLTQDSGATTPWQSAPEHGIETASETGQGRPSYSLAPQSALGWRSNRDFDGGIRRDLGAPNHRSQLKPVMPQPEMESFPRLATRQAPVSPTHRPTWDYHYPRHQTFP
ncbi:MAG: hypothetical protein AAGG44_05825 [Planctomycetota bacterium]